MRQVTQLESGQAGIQTCDCLPGFSLASSITPCGFPWTGVGEWGGQLRSLELHVQTCGREHA